jgi:Zn-dependent peptidase ImmA (M78 family)
MLSDQELEQIERQVEAFRLDHGVPEDTVLDLTDLLVRMRIKGTISEFEVRPTGGNFSGEYDASRNTIAISERAVTKPTMRDRFTIAHEIGHRADGHTGIRHRRTDSSRQFGKQVALDEQRADAFAAALLAPESLAAVTEATKAEELAKRFEVSLLQRRYRLKNGIRRALPAVMNSSQPEETGFDSGDYASAMAQMLRNARRWTQ